MASTARSSGAPTARRQEVEASLLEATEELLAEGQPFADLSVERIATRAGISRTAFYFYFADKNELLVRLISDVNALILELADLWWGRDGSPTDRVREALANTLAIYREHAFLLRAVVEAAAWDEQVAGHRRTLVNRVAEVTERHIEEENAAGSASCPHPRQTALALTWMTDSAFLQSEGSAPRADDRELIEALTSIWVRAIYGAG